MAIAGQRNKPSALKAVLKGEPPVDGDSLPVLRTEPLSPPTALTTSQKALWVEFIDTAWWLTEHDAPKAYIWCVLQDQFQTDNNLIAAKIANLRSIGSELGFDPASRARMAAGVTGTARADPTDRFFE